MKHTNDESTPDAEAKPSSAKAGEKFSLTEIKELIELVAAKEFNEFELKRGGFRLRLQKGLSPAAAESTPSALFTPTTAPTSAGAEAAAPTPSAPPPSPAPVLEPQEELHIVSAPIVGTFYRAASPTAEPFVKIGDYVEARQTICIIEAMKLMNEIASDASGAIAKIFVENGQPVEYGQPLFGIKV